MTAKEVVQAFWEAMATNDFVAASKWLSADYELSWPQSGERILGPENFAAVNTNYPANGTWHFTLNALVAEENEVVSDVSVTDGAVQARVITFSAVEKAKIVKQIEFWPESFEAPAWRRAWVESSSPGAD